MSPIWVVVRKELVDALRDRRSLFSALLMPLCGPLLLVLVLDQALGAEKSLVVPVAGCEHAPGLCAWLERNDVRVAAAPADPLAAVKSGAVDLVLIVPERFPADLRAGRRAELELVTDESRPDAIAAARQIDALVKARARELGALRLLARGVDPAVAEPVALRTIDLATPRSRAAALLNVVPMFVLLAAFLGGLYVATDSTAGERERGSLEPLLINPVSRRALVLGKWLAAVTFSIATTLLALGSSLLALQQLRLERFGISYALAPRDAALLVLAVVPLAPFVAGMQILVASFARSFKEAQTYVGLMVLVPMLPALLLGLRPLAITPALAAVPMLGQQLLVTAVVRGEPAPLQHYLVAAIVSALLGTCSVLLTARLFTRERVIFGRA